MEQSYHCAKECPLLPFFYHKYIINTAMFHLLRHNPKEQMTNVGYMTFTRTNPNIYNHGTKQQYSIVFSPVNIHH